ncbi:hypothetical protein ASPZODRAFT_128280 [Penicilliopsis zonata CBS 506.65]|uniref:mRNA export factor GLE1 n=1 Tax=Penicilliopsis zonata CBS 506.65 TaxID=1073090 RepID=A0A1L9SRL0_9EURO|nr:hypothetical protein ASPZODRAFT_128280 [Penicilliopsis zonata CBS 506.65]OJJ49757.1 hypothetical protein ASPZODRAFT_128280 [Penicilliopsis zonata CBS 506.65]
MGRSGLASRLDSPSRQLVWDLARELEQVRLHNVEVKKVKAYERRSFYEKLDRIDRERAAEHNAALDKVAELHDKVREEAEGVLKEHLWQVEQERLRKEEEARKERERVEREKAEKLRQAQEEAARLEAERKAQEEARRKAAEEAEKARKAEQEEKERKEREKAEQETQKRIAEQQKAEKEALQREAEASKKAQIEQQKKIGASNLSQEETRIHLRYVELHQHLKKFRKWLRDESKNNPVVKQNMGDLRRSIKKCVGQLREGKGANKGQLQEIRTTLEKALSIPEPSVGIRQFFAFPPESIANSDDNKVPALLIYTLNIFAKSLIASLITEAGINLGHAEPIGIVAAQIFSMDTFTYKGCHLVDLLWAKYRVVCPALWGFYGDEKTTDGKAALGWWRQEAGGPFVPEQTHADRMTALGAGFAALTLRNFGKTPRKNPFPNTMFWHSMHKILSLPASELQETHIILLAAMLHSSAQRIVGFFGHMGLALIRKAIVDVPKNLPRQSMGVNKLKLLKDLYKREKNILI